MYLRSKSFQKNFSGYKIFYFYIFSLQFFFKSYKILFINKNINRTFCTGQIASFSLAFVNNLSFFLFLKGRLMVNQMHRGKGISNGHPMFPTFLQQHLQHPRKFDPSENWYSSRCLTSVITQELVFPSWHKSLLDFVNNRVSVKHSEKLKRKMLFLVYFFKKNIGFVILLFFFVHIQLLLG